MADIKIDPVFAKLMPKHRPQELHFLRESISDEGCREPLVVWEGHDILVDGHTRYAICKELDAPYRIDYRHFENRSSVLKWMKRRAVSRRNLKPQDFDNLIGELGLEIEKDLLSQAADTKEDTSSAQFGPQASSAKGGVRKTAAREAAKETGVSQNTAVRLMERSEALAKLPPEMADPIRAGDVKLNKPDVARLADVHAADKAKADAVWERLTSKKFRTVTHALEDIANEQAPAEAMPVEQYVEELAAPYDEARKALQKILRDFEKLSKDPAANCYLLASGRWMRAKKSIEDAKAVLLMATPEIHHRCKGLGCQRCGDTGWVCRDVNRNEQAGAA